MIIICVHERDFEVDRPMIKLKSMVWKITREIILAVFPGEVGQKWIGAVMRGEGRILRLCNVVNILLIRNMSE